VGRLTVPVAINSAPLVTCAWQILPERMRMSTTSAVVVFQLPQVPLGADPAELLVGFSLELAVI
jgi:hypothetical protein